MHQPKVMPRSAKYGSNYWNTEGPKVDKREVTLYSDLEFDNWVTVDSDPNVETYCEQYPEITYVYDGVLHSSVFDMWIRYHDGSEIYREVKYEVELNENDPRNERTLRQIAAQRAYCIENNFTYEVLTEKILRKNPQELENRLKIISFIKNSSNQKAAEVVLNHINDKRRSLQTLSELTTLPYALIHDNCLWLYYHGAIHINLDEKIICKQSEVWLREQSESH
ncbi:MAG: TnsA endonuclease N-terminal domain-containing protein [Candidatus Pristimantibacillus sp.]